MESFLQRNREAGVTARDEPAGKSREAGKLTIEAKVVALAPLRFRV